MLIKIGVTKDLQNFEEKEIDATQLGPVEQSEWVGLQPGMFIHYSGEICAVISAFRKFEASGQISKEIKLKILDSKEIERIETQVRFANQQREQAERMQNAGLVTASTVPAELRSGS